MTNPPQNTERAEPRRRIALRTPSQVRGLVRYEGLVDATEALLTDHNPDDVGLYQIAERARARPASVYHFFPTKEAAFLALVLRYIEGLNSNSRAPLPASALDSWQTLMKWDERRAMDYINAHPPALKLMYGGYGGFDTRQADIAINRHLGRLTYLRLAQAFHMPAFPDADRKFHIGLEMIDAVWSISYLYEGRISEEYFEDSHAACVAYFRLFLPERVDLLEAHRQTLGRGEEVVLPPLPQLDARAVIDPEIALQV